MDLVTYDDYDKISEKVRQYCAQKYVALLDSLQPYINGDLGDITPGHAAAYINVVKELGRLYGAQKPPRDPEAMIPATKVAALLAAAEARQEERVAAAVAETEQRLRRELEARHHSDGQHARTQVLEKLSQVRKQG
jgi:hypothetical protein